jgi:tetratricopeptide (TPR) repeat protein
LAYRFGSLDPALRRRLGVLGLFQGFVSTRVLAAISAQDGAPELVREWGRDGWMRLLDAVAGLGLLKRAAPGNYLIHTAVQSKLHDLLTEALSENVAWLQRTFCAIYGRVGNQLFQIHQANAELALALLRSEQDNLTCAFRLARRRKDWGAVSDLLCGLRMLLVVHGRWTEWEGLISELETEVISGESEVPSDLETLSFRLVGHRAEICEYRHDHVRLSLLQQGLRERYQIKGGAPRQADVLKDLGAISEQRGQFDEAERFYLKSLAIRQQAGDEAAQASLLLHLGDLAGQQRRWREADRWYRHSLGLWKRLGQADLQATTCCRLAAICQERGELEEAEDWFKQTLAIRAQLGGEPRQAAALHQLGRIAHEQRQYGLAEQRYRQSLQFRQTMGDEPGLAATLHQLGRLARDQKQFAEAESYFHQALAIRERLGDRPGQAQTIHQLGNIAFLEGHYEEAESWYQQSLKIRQALHDAPGQARNLNQLAKIAQARGDATIAEEYLNCVEALADQIQDPISGLSTLIVIGPK